MVDLSLQTRVLLLAELQLKFDDFLLLSEVGDERTKLRELRVRIIGRLSFPILGRRGRRRLLDTCCMATDGLEVLMQKVVLFGEVFAPGWGVSAVVE